MTVAASPLAFTGPISHTDDDVRTELLVKGAHCGGCLAKIEAAMRAQPGVRTARFNLTTGKLAITADKARVDANALIEAIEKIGFSAVRFDPSAALIEEDREGRRLALALGVAAFGAMNVMMFTVPVWAGLFGQELNTGMRQTLLWLAGAVAAPCALVAGVPFFRSAIRSLRKGRANMDVPISIGVLLTLAVSFQETILGGAHAYFDAAVMLLFLLLIGRYLDHALRRKARSAARDLLALQAPTAVIIGQNGERTRVPVAEVAAGNRLAVAAGQRIPVDVEVVAGASDIDNSLISGETLPIKASPGVRLHAGALNHSGELIVTAIAPSSDSAVAAILRLMEAGAQSRSRYVRLSDKAAAIYVPAVHTIALATFLGGWALGLGPREAILRAAAVLIVTCPCALGLAVPAVQIAATGRLFRKGVLVKSGVALERLAEVDHIVFDKTGVLTEGRPALLPVDADWVRQAAPLARASVHPLAKVIAEAAGPGDTATDVLETAGMGVEGRIGTRYAWLGRAAYVGAHSSGSETELWFALDGEPPRRLAFHDQIRPEAAQTVKALQRAGYSIEILSGDVAGSAEEAATMAGITTWRAGLTPTQKVEILRQRAAEGRRVLMVGDGLNDAAALSTAHASMAPGAAVDAAQNAADIVYANGDLGAVPLALDLARKARRRSLENVGFATLYNLVAAPAAILGLINPFIAALAMSGSSLAVTLNALRISWTGKVR